jgi:hypothetical protein
MPPLSRSDILFFYPVALTADEIDGFVAHLFDRGVPNAHPDAVPLPFSSENPPPLVRVLFFLNLSQINYLTLSSEQDIYPPHQVNADLSDSTGEDRRQTAGDDVEGPGIPLMLVRVTHNTEGSSLCQFLPLASKSRNILIFMPCRSNQLVCSTYPFV